MASTWTEFGAENALRTWLRNEEVVTNFYVALITSAVAPDTEGAIKSTFTEVASGNGYTTGGISLTRNTTDFDVVTLDDVNNIMSCQIKDLVWTAAGGTLPASGGGARYAIFTDDNITQGSREVYISWDLVSDRSVSDGQTLTLQNCEFQIDVG